MGGGGVAHERKKRVSQPSWSTFIRERMQGAVEQIRDVKGTRWGECDLGQRKRREVEADKW